MTIDCLGTTGSLPHLWSRCVGAGRACEGLRAAWQEQLLRAREACGFEYIRFHGLLAEDMFVCQLVDGRMVYNWYYIDALYDFLLKAGLRPVVELGFMPPALASGGQTQFWWKGNITPPADFARWDALIGALVRHWQERYGLEEIRRWYFEVWNEPNLSGFWTGTKSEYFELYRHTALAVKQVDSRLRVGGPATSNFVPDGRFDGEREDAACQLTHRVEDLDSLAWHGVWIEDFLRFCAAEGLPVDFVSCHPYPTDWALDGQGECRGRTRSRDSLRADLTWLRETVARSAFPRAEIHLTEWNSSPSPRDCSHDGLPAADYILRCNLDCAHLADSLSYWVFTDIFEEGGGGPEAFHGGFGLMSMHGIPKPAWHAYRFLHLLGDTVVARQEESIVTRKADGSVQLLAWNYARDVLTAPPLAAYPDHDGARAVQRRGEPRSLTLTLTHLQPGAAFILERMAEEDTAAFLWDRMGRPASLTRAQEAALLALAPRKAILRADEHGCLTLDTTLAPWEILCLYQAG
ncbi:MAG: hypothetical protein ACI4O7_06900 [Aristaeellaceae bacterium]